MAPPNERAANIDEVCQRLRLWAARDGRGLARVEYSSDFSRQKVLSQLAPALAEKGIALTTIELPQGKTAPEVVQFLLNKLAEVASGVVSVSGFASALQTHESLEASLRIINYNREALTTFPLRQIWWMTPVLLQTSLHAMPDMHGWFSPYLTLAEATLYSQRELMPSDIEAQSRLNSNIDDARQRSRRLLEQFEKALSAGATDIELLTIYLLPALESLAEVGAQKEVRALMTQHKDVLDVLHLVDLSKEDVQSINAATNLNRLAYLYYLQGRYSEAEPLYQQALNIRQAELGDRHPDTANSLNNLALLYELQSRYSEAETLFQQALNINQAELGNRHPDTAASLNNLALLYRSQGRYSEAEPLFQQALNIAQATIGNRHPDTAISLNNLAGLYESQGRYSEAEPLYQQALDIKRAELGDRHPSTAASLNNLALLYRLQGRYSEAEPLFQQALDIHQAELGDRHPDTAASLNNLALLYESQGRYSEAEPLYQQAFNIRQAELGSRHPSTATSLNNLAGLYESQGRYSKAEPFFQQALDINQAELGSRHPSTANSLFNLAAFYYRTQKHQEALSHIQRALAIYTETLGTEHPNTKAAYSWLQPIQQAASEEAQP